MSRTNSINKRLKFCIVSQYFLPDINGDVIRLLNSLKVLKKFHLDLIIITAFPHYPDGEIPSKYRGKLFVKELWDDIKIIRTFVLPLPHKGFVNRLSLYLSFTFSSIIGIFLERKINVVWAFSQKFFSYTTGLASKLLHRSKVIMDITDIWPEAIVNTGYIKDKGILFHLIKVVVCLLLKFSDVVTTPTQAMRNMLSLCGLNQDRVILVPNVLGLRTENIAKEMPTQFLGKQKFTIMYSGNLGSNYDFKTLLTAAYKLRCNHNIIFVIRGYGEMRDYISKFVRNYRLDNVVLDERLLSEEELVNYLKKADVFILPMKECPYPDASFPIKFLDYLSLGRPIICCSEGFLAEFVTENKIGIAIPPGDSIKLVEAILSIRKDRKLVEQMSENIKATVVHFSPAALEKSFHMVFHLIRD